MTAHQWVRITACSNIPRREGRAVLVGDRELALFNLGDQFLATENRCPHQGGPLCDGIVTGTSVVCPLHAWKVDLTSGEVERPAHARAHCVATFPTRVEDGIVLVSLPALSEVEGPALSEVEGPALSEVEGPVLNGLQGRIHSNASDFLVKSTEMSGPPPLPEGDAVCTFDGRSL